MDRVTGQTIEWRDLVNRTLTDSRPLETSREGENRQARPESRAGPVCAVEMSDWLSGPVERAAADVTRGLERVRER